MNTSPHLDIKEIQTYFDDLKMHYGVQDIIRAEANVVFILESPHIQEIKYGAPVSGLSGRSMSKVLLNGEETPLGILLNEAPFRLFSDPKIRRMGVMNISPIPMQGEAYGNGTERQRALFAPLEKLRIKSRQHHFRDQTMQSIHQVLLVDFKKRLEQSYREDITWVPCGKFAQGFMGHPEIMGMISEEQVLWGCPHPSFGQWHRESNRDIIERVKNLF